MIVLYVAHDLEDHEMMCPGSTLCLSLMEKVEDSVINVQDCDVLRKSKILPGWLNGTPIVIDENEGVPYKGKHAIKKMRMLQQQFPKTEEQPVAEQGDEDLDAAFKINVQPIQESSGGKVTEQDLQRYMEARNASPAGQNAKSAQ